MFDREFMGSRWEKALSLREEASLAAQLSEFESRSQGLEVRKRELDKLSESLHQWRQELQETASQQAVAEIELEGERKSLARRESLTTTMEQALVRQRECLKKMKEAVQEAVRKL